MSSRYWLETIQGMWSGVEWFGVWRHNSIPYKKHCIQHYNGSCFIDNCYSCQNGVAIFGIKNKCLPSLICWMLQSPWGTFQTKKAFQYLFYFPVASASTVNPFCSTNDVYISIPITESFGQQPLRGYNERNPGIKPHEGHVMTS